MFKSEWKFIRKIFLNFHSAYGDWKIFAYRLRFHGVIAEFLSLVISRQRSSFSVWFVNLISNTFFDCKIHFFIVNFNLLIKLWLIVRIFCLIFGIDCVPYKYSAIMSSFLNNILLTNNDPIAVFYVQLVVKSIVFFVGVISTVWPAWLPSTSRTRPARNDQLLCLVL